MKTPIYLLLMSCLASAGLAVDTPEFDSLRTSYKAAMAKATQPINQTYLAELTKLRDTYARAAKLDAANKVQAEIDAMKSDESSTTNRPVALAPTTSSRAETIAAVPANDVNGYKMGPLKKGNTITLSYVSGRWKDHGKIPTDNPDADFTEMGEKTRLVIANGRFKTQPGPALVVVPAGTANKPFSYTLAEDIENVVIRINEDSKDYEDNPGSVTYKLKISR